MPALPATLATEQILKIMEDKENKRVLNKCPDFHRKSATFCHNNKVKLIPESRLILKSRPLDLNQGLSGV